MEVDFQRLDANCISSENECSFNLQPYIDVQPNEQCDRKGSYLTKEENRHNDDISARTGNIYNDQLAFFAEFINGVKYGFPRDIDLRRSESHSRSNTLGICTNNNNLTANSWAQNHYPVNVKQEQEPSDNQFNHNNNTSNSSINTNSSKNDSSEPYKDSSMGSLLDEVQYTPSIINSKCDSKASIKNLKRLSDKESDEYRKRRERNNIAVRKSREKAKQKSKDTERRVIELERDNDELRQRVEELRNQLNMLKKVLMKFGIQPDNLNLHTPTFPID